MLERYTKGFINNQNDILSKSKAKIDFNNSAYSEPLISVVIPTLQEEKIIEKSLMFYSKEFKDKYSLELIISDGGSSDRTLEIADKYADIIIKHDSTKRQTIADGRNQGAMNAKGKTIVFINCDTIPENIESFYQFIKDWTLGINDYSKYLALACTVMPDTEKLLFKDRIFYGFHNFYVRFLNEIGMGMGRGECQIVNSNVFKEINGYNPTIAAGEDFDLYRRISKQYKIGFVEDLCVFESPRRFRKDGYTKTVFLWTINSLSVWMLGRSVSEKWEEVR